MKSFELREQRDEDLRTRLAEVKEEFFNLRFQNATGQLENYNQLGKAKRDIARMETILRERELDIEATPQAPAKQADEKAAKASRKWGRKSKQATEDSSTEDTTDEEEADE